MIKLEINNLTRSEVDKRFLKKVAEKTCESLPRARRIAPSQGRISLVIVGNARIKDLNEKYLKRNQVTDVLAFDYGEIFVCLSQAKKQAKQLGHPLEKELAILLIHGILHLAGYNDATKIDYNKMMKMQESIFNKIKNKK